MKQFNVLASKLRINVLLCCSAAVLLTACGGNIDAGGEALSASAAGVSTDAGAAASTAATAGAVEAVAEAAPATSTAEAPAAAGTEAAPAVASAEAASAEAAGTAGATGQAADPTAHSFELSGYDSNPLQAQAAHQDTGANASGSIRQ